MIANFFDAGFSVHFSTQPYIRAFSRFSDKDGNEEARRNIEQIEQRCKADLERLSFQVARTEVESRRTNASGRARAAGASVVVAVRDAP